MQEPGVSASLMRDIDASLHRLQGDRRAAALQIVIEGKSNEEAAQGSVRRCRYSAGNSRPWCGMEKQVASDRCTAAL
jgi:hypothetical protein